MFDDAFYSQNKFDKKQNADYISIIIRAIFKFKIISLLISPAAIRRARRENNARRRLNYHGQIVAIFDARLIAEVSTIPVAEAAAIKAIVREAEIRETEKSVRRVIVEIIVVTRGIVSILVLIIKTSRFVCGALSFEINSFTFQIFRPQTRG